MNGKHFAPREVFAVYDQAMLHGPGCWLVIRADLHADANTQQLSWNACACFPDSEMPDGQAEDLASPSGGQAVFNEYMESSTCRFLMPLQLSKGRFSGLC